MPETPGYSRASLGQSLVSPWNSPGQNTRVDSLSLLQGIFPTQGSNPGLPHCRQILYQLSHQGIPREDTREDSTHGHHQMVNTEIRLIIFFAAKVGEALYSQQKQDWESKKKKTRLGADCDSDHELLIAKFRLKLKKVAKTTRLFRYDLS